MIHGYHQIISQRGICIASDYWFQTWIMMPVVTSCISTRRWWPSSLRTTKRKGIPTSWRRNMTFGCEMGRTDILESYILGLGNGWGFHHQIFRAKLGQAILGHSGMGSGSTKTYVPIFWVWTCICMPFCHLGWCSSQSFDAYQCCIHCWMRVSCWLVPGPLWLLLLCPGCRRLFRVHDDDDDDDDDDAGCGGDDDDDDGRSFLWRLFLPRVSKGFHWWINPLILNQVRTRVFFELQF